MFIYTNKMNKLKKKLIKVCNRLNAANLHSFAKLLLFRGVTYK